MSTAARQVGIDTAAIRPFRVSFPEAALADLRRRINASVWPDKETVSDESEGIQLAVIQKLARYWGTEYDWRRCEARLNALPQFKTKAEERAAAKAEELAPFIAKALARKKMMPPLADGAIPVVRASVAKPAVNQSAA